MKTRKILVLALVLVLAVLALFACNAKDKEPLVLTDSENLVVLQPTSEYAGKTVLEFMNIVKEKGEIDFVVENGMVTSVNGKEQSYADNNYWMIYTSDESHSNTAWGTAEYKGKVYGSADTGVTELPIAENCIYILAYQHVEF